METLALIANASGIKVRFDATGWKGEYNYHDVPAVSQKVNIVNFFFSLWNE